MTSVAVLRATSAFAAALSAQGDSSLWVGCQMLDTECNGIMIYVGQATSIPFYCVDDKGELRSVRTLVVSGRKKLSLI
jgi:hypothetical protein